jgi:hypothetical protein
MPCSTRSIRRAGWSAGPDTDHTSRLVFIVRDLAPDDILQRFAEGEPLAVAPA